MAIFLLSIFTFSHLWSSIALRYSILEVFSYLFEYVFIIITLVSASIIGFLQLKDARSSKKRNLRAHVLRGERQYVWVYVYVKEKLCILQRITLTEPNEIALERNNIYVTSYASGFAFTNVIAEFPS